MPALTDASIALEEVSEVDDFGIKEVFLRRTDNYAKEGLFQRFNADGQLMEEANYNNNELDGQRVLYYENGDTNSIETLSHGKYEGSYRLFHENGQIAQEGIYVNNEMSGPWKTYYENGQVKEVVEFKENAENGPFVEYYENGQLKAEGTYLDGDSEQGELNLYDKSGELVRRMECDRGICKTIWKKTNEDT